ncbi:MAG: tyrosine-type recombinase/integrase [Phycisphaerae bacterium]
MTVFGKGGKTRSILIPPSVWEQLQFFRDGAGDDAPVFRSRKGGHLDPSQMLRIVHAAAKHAGLSRVICCHAFRHSHASHAIDRNCPLSLVQATLGHSSVASTNKYLHARVSDSSSRYLPL